MSFREWQPGADSGGDPEVDAEGVDSERAPPGAVLLEGAWEVCNQVGGIYQVLRSKAETMLTRWGNRYWLVGPYVESKAALEFEPRRPTGWMAPVVESLRAEGLIVHTGRWLIPGRPRAVLLEHGLSAEKLDAVKYRFWKDHGIDSPPSDPLVNGALSFAEGCRKLVKAVCEHWGGAADSARRDRRVMVHFHEWLGGAAIPMIRHEQLPASIAFTTHATLLGRYIASSGENLYDLLPTVNHEAEATRFNIRTQHLLERACAHGSHVFTTVSPVTGEECASLLGRQPDMILPNGLNIDRYNVGHDFQTLHAQFKERIHRFVMGHFFPSYQFDLDKTLYAFTSGRYEPRNKGFDVCLEAMARLNGELRARDVDVNVVFFIVSQRPTRSLHPHALESRGVLNELREVCARVTRDLGEQLFRRAAAGQRVRLDDLVDEYWTLRLRRTQAALRTDRLPGVVTHTLEDEATDPVLTQIRALNLLNRPTDRVKIVYHPDFIKPVNPLWGLEYEQFVRGCHLGVFPSAYEPWGYTPLECIAMGVPAITSDLAGFGRYVAEAMPDHDRWGLTVLKRRGRTFDQAAGDLAAHLLEFCEMDRRGRIAVRNEVERRSWDFDWSRLGQAYHWAHDLAMARAAAGVF
jgi:glycogen(starch) synthase